MSCGRMEKQMLPYVDGRLKVSEQRAVEAHLADCAACRLRVNEFRAVSGLLDELPQIEPSGAFDARVRARPGGRGEVHTSRYRRAAHRSASARDALPGREAMARSGDGPQRVEGEGPSPSTGVHSVESAPSGLCV